ncbi:HDOD domain-containing protein [Inhella sp.]|uniref:HDOD domain-containing protein n=1 Tax=Inhella sp. TaxID=1921806 RepID=UPI0035B40C93
MLWHVRDTRSPRELLLLLPRQGLGEDGEREAWLQRAALAARVEHPALAVVADQGFVEHWPYLAFSRSLGLTVDERLARHRVPQPQQAAAWLQQAGEALATAHDAGWLLADLQPFHLLLAEDGRARLIGLGLLGEPGQARARHQAGVEDEVLCLGLLLNRLLQGRAPLETADTREVLKRLPPQGSDFVRLGFEQAHPVDDAMRAIVNRATATQPVQRYLHARPFARALEGWLERSRNPEGGAVATLLERLQRFGCLPVSRGEAVKLVAAGGLERQHQAAMSGLVQQDAALTLELLRRVNLARRQAGTSTDTVLSLQRAITLLGQTEVRQLAAGLRPWPGILAPERVLNLRLALARSHKAADVAVPLAPAGYDPEVLRLTVLLQNLGRLLLYYHLPEEADQVQRLMKAPEASEAHPHPQGLTERQAAFSVLGCDLDALGSAAIRYLGLGDDAQLLAQRPEPDAPIHAPHGDLEALRWSCSLANELVDALALPEPRRRQTLEAVTRRYARALGLSARDIQLALFPESAQAAVQHTLA